ncbi:MAG: TetR/AcrR family transcriptional regulator [Actinomycetes bacterium]
MAKGDQTQVEKPMIDPPSTPRARLVADTAITVLAEQGSRGLTHRAIDRAAGLPEGSTSNLFRTRDALLAATLRRQVERETEMYATMPTPESIADIDSAARWMAALIHAFTSADNSELVSARYELFLEGQRRPTFRKLLDEVRDNFILMVDELLGRLGLERGKRNSMAVLVTLDGLSANQVFHRTSILSEAEIKSQLAHLLASFKPA